MPSAPSIEQRRPQRANLNPLTQSKKNMKTASLLITAALVVAASSAAFAKVAVEKITIEGKTLSLKVPAEAATGKPWLWVGEFAGHLRSFEDALVAKGWHVAYP